MAKESERDIVQDWIDTHDIETLNEDILSLKRDKENHPDTWPMIKSLHMLFMTFNSERLAAKERDFNCRVRHFIKEYNWLNRGDGLKGFLKEYNRGEGGDNG